jgi:hypothetical protein
MRIVCVEPHVCQAVPKGGQPSQARAVGPNCTRILIDTSCFIGLLCDKYTRGLPERCWDPRAFCESVTTWHRLKPDVEEEIMDETRGAT